jgi:hypothetical protein
MERLSNDVKFSLAARLRLPDLFNLAATCHTFYKLIKNDLLFRALFYRDFGRHIRVYTVDDLREWCSPFNDLHEGLPVTDSHTKDIEESRPQSGELERLADMPPLPVGCTWRVIYVKFYKMGESIRSLMRQQARLDAPITCSSNTKTYHLHPEGWAKETQISVIVTEPSRQGSQKYALKFLPIYMDLYADGCKYFDFDAVAHQLHSIATPLKLLNMALEMAAYGRSQVYSESDLEKVLAHDVICVRGGIALRVHRASSDKHPKPLAQYELIYPIHALHHYLNQLKAEAQVEYKSCAESASEFLNQTLLIDYSLELPKCSHVPGLAVGLLGQLKTRLSAYFRECDLRGVFLGSSFDKVSNTLSIQHLCTRKPRWALQSDQCHYIRVKTHSDEDGALTLTKTFCTSTNGVTGNQPLCNAHAHKDPFSLHKHEVAHERHIYSLAPHLRLKPDLQFVVKNFDGCEVQADLQCTQLKVLSHQKSSQ